FPPPVCTVCNNNVPIMHNVVHPCNIVLARLWYIYARYCATCCIAGTTTLLHSWCTRKKTNHKKINNLIVLLFSSKGLPSRRAALGTLLAVATLPLGNAFATLRWTF